MKGFSHLSVKEQKKLSFIIISSKTNKKIQFSIPQWIVIASSILIISLIIGTANFSYKLIHANKELTYVNERLYQLAEENDLQADEITYLRTKSSTIEEKLAGLNELQNQVLNMVGLEAKAHENKSISTFLVSRSDPRGTVKEEDLEDIDFELEMEMLNELIEKQRDSMEQLIVDVEKQLKYIESQPNLMPSAGRITSPFGYRISPINRKREFHSGIDIANKTNTDVYAAGSGIVTFAGYNGAYGRMVIVSHGYGYTSVYAHNNKLQVKVGDKVSKGDVIAKMGSTGRSTGPHLHFEIRVNGQAVDPKTILEN